MVTANKDTQSQPEPSQSRLSEQRFDVEPHLTDALKKVRQPITMDDMELRLSGDRYRGTEAIEYFICGRCELVV